jgi:hypothetical protein
MMFNDINPSILKVLRYCFRTLMAFVLGWNLVSCPESNAISSQVFNGLTLHLNPTGGNDANDGSQARPLKSFQAAFDKMIPIKASGQNVRILFYPGVYREQLIGNDARPFWRIPDNAALLVLEAQTPGETIITGSDVWTDWQSQGAGVWTKTWSFKWGGNIPKWGGPPIPEGAVRRELVFVKGERLKQVLELGKLELGSFLVDESSEKIILKLTDSLDPNRDTTEVSVREQLFYIWNTSNVTLRGLVFQHSANGFAQAAVSAQIGQKRRCNNLTIENTRFDNNGQVGFESFCDQTIIRSSTANDNGFGGILGGISSGWTLEDNQTNRNGWRSWAFGYKGWATAGLKVVGVTNFVARRHQSLDNDADGFWVDTQNANVTVEDSLIARNKWNGLFFEASDGPFLARNNTICNNGLSDLILASSRQIKLENNRIISTAALNTEVPAQNLAILFGETRRKEPGNPDFGVDKAQYPLREITLSANTIVAGNGRRLTSSYFYFADPKNPDNAEIKTDYEAFMATLNSKNNTWFSSASKPFNLTSGVGYAEDIDFAGWKALTGQDSSSSFRDPKLSCPN